TGLDGLKEIPGIGEHIAEKIEELLKTGKQTLHQKLLKEFPREFIGMMEVPGIGPKTALLLRKKLKIDSIARLQGALKKGLLQKLPGFKEKKIENIKKGLELKEHIKGRFLLSEADRYVSSIVSQLNHLKEIEKVLPAGSYRRGKETVGDIDILVASRKAEAVMKTFVKLPQVKRVLAKGTTRSSVILKNEMQADIRVVEPESFGAAAHYFTGSKQHNIAIREMAVKKGLKISEYGVFRGEKRIAGKSEEEIFQAVGLPFIPPELREGTGEIETAQEGRLPKLIELSDIRGDLQMHTAYSDGGNSMEEMAEAAKSLGYEYIAVTDHTKSTRVAGGQTGEEVIREIGEIERINARLSGFRILKGAEVDILPDGTLDLSDAVLKELDVVIAAIHSNFKMEREKMTRRIIRAFQNKYVNLLSHPTGRLIGKRAPYAVDMHEIIKAAKDTGTYLELNAYPERLDLSDVHCKQAKEAGVMIAINTDAHAAVQLGIIKYGVVTARRGWLEKKDVLNALPLDKLLVRLKAKR
ncbi:DNA polymerase/3'-5' exonuclease PolX, partial [Candidatus Saganbacteria bacterium]|nr:DNA polymerase/3'-5' exonuclease PolX [Candidatus Saganbacteria bacterium]